MQLPTLKGLWRKRSEVALLSTTNMRQKGARVVDDLALEQYQRARRYLMRNRVQVLAVRSRVN